MINTPGRGRNLRHSYLKTCTNETKHVCMARYHWNQEELDQENMDITWTQIRACFSPPLVSAKK